MQTDIQAVEQKPPIEDPIIQEQKKALEAAELAQQKIKEELTKAQEEIMMLKAENEKISKEATEGRLNIKIYTVFGWGL